MRRLAGLVMAAALLAGCGQARGSDERPAAPWGVAYTSTDVTEAGAPKRLADGTRIELRFRAGGRLVANAGCNTMSGDARLDGERLRVDTLETTEMGCDPPRHEQDRWFAAFLQQEPSWRLDGDRLTLTAGGTSVALVADAPRPLTGTRWTVDTLVRGDTAGSVPAGVEAHLTFTGDGKVTGSGGCNQFGGSWTAAGDTITFSDVTANLMACADDRATVEAAVLATLRGEVRYAIDGDHLSLTAPDGTGLRLAAR